MRRLSPRVNVIPCIGKADGLTPTELAAFKKRVRASLLLTLLELPLIRTSSQIMEDIEYYGIPVYNFPYDVEEDDEDTIADNSELRVSADA
jgi:cell division control protein 11